MEASSSCEHEEFKTRSVVTGMRIYVMLLLVLLCLGHCSIPTAYGALAPPVGSRRLMQYGKEHGGYGNGSQFYPSLPNKGRALGMTAKIVGGGQIPISAAPYQVLIYVNHPATENWTCGGTLIDPEYVLSAAHCLIVEGDNVTEPQYLSVRIGSSSRDNGGEMINVTKIWQHPEYTEMNKTNDIALLKLDRAVNISSSVMPVKLAVDDTNLVEFSDISITGWGTTKNTSGELDDGILSLDLRGTTIDHLPNGCKDNFLFDPKVMICAGCTQGGADSCFGDSGGPAVTFSKSGGCPVLVGVTSFGSGCGEPGSPGVYAKVSAVADWLEAQAGKSFRSQYNLRPLKNCQVCSSFAERRCGWVPKFNYTRCQEEAWMASAFMFALRPCLAANASSEGPQAPVEAYFNLSSVGSLHPVGSVYFLQGRSGKGSSVLKLGSTMVTVPVRGPIVSRSAAQDKNGTWSMLWPSSEGQSACNSTYQYAAAFVSEDTKFVQVSYPAVY